MRFSAFAADYDGTLATRGIVPKAVIEALRRFKRSGRALVLVTGREMRDLLQFFPEVALFDRVVAENGALLYRPQDRSERLLATPPSAELLAALRARRVSPLGFGRIVIGSERDQTPKILAAIRDCAADAEISFNKHSVMILPRGVDKASGLRAALDELGLSPDQLVAAGDGENDIPMLEMATRGVAVSGALESVRMAADCILTADAGQGVIDLIAKLLLTPSLPNEVRGHAAAVRTGAMLENINRLPDPKDHSSGAYGNRELR